MAIVSVQELNLTDGNELHKQAVNFSKTYLENDHVYSKANVRNWLAEELTVSMLRKIRLRTEP